MSEQVVAELERTIKAICKAIRKEGDFGPDKLKALARLVSALTEQERGIWDPMEHGDPYIHEGM